MSEENSLAKIVLKGQADRRIRAGHIWVYSNEVDTNASPLKAFTPGQQVEVIAASGKPMGVGFVNPNALICVRLFTRSAREITPKFLEKRLQSALALRECHYEKPYYRLVYGDSDGLPGLVVDRFGSVFVVQISSAGMEQFREEVVRILEKLFQPQAVVMKNDGKMREVEQLDSYVEVAYGTLPEKTLLEENGVHFEIDPIGGQKTGWFFDHRESRAKLRHYVKGKRVLDLFCYAGGWGIQAASFGASEVVGVDAAENALQVFQRNAELNGVAERCKTIQGDVFEVMKTLIQEGEKYDVVICDPPALIPRRKDMKNGEQAYARLNQMALRLLADQGILVSASCSMHLSMDTHMDLVRSAGRHVDRYLQVVGQFGQAPDHPILPGVPETAYLKALFARASWRW